MIHNFELSNDQEFKSTITNSTIEHLQILVKFEESFPFLELKQLLQIMKNTNDEHREFLLPKALKVATKMKNKFANSLSPDYEKWVAEIHCGIMELQSYRTYQATVNSKPQDNNPLGLKINAI